MSYTTQHILPWEMLGEGKRKPERQRPRGGGGCGTPKLTEAQVREIRASPLRPCEIARLFNLTRDYARKVQLGETHQYIR